jgi:hypothetical protein
VTAEAFDPGHIVCPGGSIRWPLRLLRKGNVIANKDGSSSHRGPVPLQRQG